MASCKVACPRLKTSNEDRHRRYVCTGTGSTGPNATRNPPFITRPCASLAFDESRLLVLCFEVIKSSALKITLFSPSTTLFSVCLRSSDSVEVLFCYSLLPFEAKNREGRLNAVKSTFEILFLFSLRFSFRDRKHRCTDDRKHG